MGDPDTHWSCHPTLALLGWVTLVKLVDLPEHWIPHQCNAQTAFFSKLRISLGGI